MISGTIAGLFVRKPDVIVGTSPQFFTACAAYLVAALRRRPFVFELRDLWPESIKAVGAMSDSAVLRTLERIELFLYRRAARIVSVTHSFRTALIKRGIDSAKIDTVTNGVDLSRFSLRPKDQALERELGLAGKFVAGYVGTHGMAHGLETLLAAAHSLQTLPQGQHIRVLFLGDGAEKGKLRAEAVRLGLSNVLFIDSVSKDQVTRYWSLLDLSIIHLRRTDLFTTVIPSKLFECMGMGIPVLHGVAGESADIVEREGVGVLFEPENSAALVQGLLRFAGDATLTAECRQRCLRAARRYDRAALGLSMLATLQAATDSTRYRAI